MKHTVTPIHLAFNTLQHRTARFDSIANANPMLFHSLDDQFIPSVTYTFTYDDSWLPEEKEPYMVGKLSHLCRKCHILIYAAFGQKFSKKEKKLLGTPFAQFLKFLQKYRYALLHQRKATDWLPD